MLGIRNVSQNWFLLCSLNKCSEKWLCKAAWWNLLSPKFHPWPWMNFCALAEARVTISDTKNSNFKSIFVHTKFFCLLVRDCDLLVLEDEIMWFSVANAATTRHRLLVISVISANAATTAKKSFTFIFNALSLSNPLPVLLRWLHGLQWENRASSPAMSTNKPFVNRKMWLLPLIHQVSFVNVQNDKLEF